MIVKTENGFKNLSEVSSDLIPKKKDIKAYFESITATSQNTVAFIKEQRAKVEDGTYAKRAETEEIKDWNIYKTGTA